MPYRKQFLDAIKQGAIDGWHKHKILPSIAGVQALHESDYGRSSLAKAPNYNIFGIKASADWKGAIVSMPTKEHVNGRTITIQANFRKYDSWGASVADYGTFFTSTEWRKNNYRHVVGERDYKKAAWALQNSGYATDPQYANKLIKRLEENGLQAWDADIDKAPTGTVNKTSVGGNLTQAGRDYLKNVPVTVLGDSLGVGTQPKLKLIMDNMTHSVKGSRQLTHPTDIGLDGTRMLQGMLTQPEMVHENLVVILGTNAGLVRSDVDKFIKIAGNRKIYWVNTASKGVINQARRDNVTNEIRRAAETYSNVYLLDWDKFSAPNWSSYYGSDSVHMNATGYTKHAEFIAQGIYEVLNSKQTEAPSIPKEQRDDDGVQLKKSYIGIENVEYDDGRFYTLKGESSIQDREANLRFSRHHSSSFGWITRPANFDLDNPNELFTEALAKLKEYSEPKIDYEVPTKLLPNSIDIGDWVDIIDHQYTPPLYVKAQVKSMRESETDEDGNVATLANYQAVESGLAAELIEAQKKLKLIENSLSDENKIELSILSSQGAVFDGDITSTLLTAKLKLNGEIITNYADSYVWWRVVDPLSEDEEWTAEGGPSLTVYETEFKYNAIYKVLAKKDGRVLSEGQYGLAKVVSGTHTGAENPVLAIDGETWTKPDGSQWVLVDGVWEEKVNQAQIFTVKADIDAAKVTADNAKAEADDARQRAEDALTEAGISTDLAQTAKDLAQLAEDNAETALTNAQSALNEAGIAASQAVQAINTADTAKTNAQTALTNAQTALTEAGSAKTTANNLTVRVDDVEAEVELKASQITVDGLSGTVSNHSTTLTQHATQIASKAESSLVNTIKGTVDTHTTDIRQNATDISSKANTATVNTLTGRVDTAESNISQNATAISQRVTTTTYNTGIGSKEDSVLKQTTAPAHLNGRLWLDTSVTPNVLKRSTGSAWVKATPTTASEVGAYSSSQGSTLAGRVTTAETNITQTSEAITSKADKSVVDTLSGTVSTHTTTIGQHATAIASKASSTSVNALTGRVGTAETNISQNATAISARLTESQVNTLVSGKGYATQTWSNQTFATPQSVTTQLQSYAKTTDLNGMVTETTLATKQFVTAGTMNTTLSNYAQKNGVPTNTQFNTLKNSYDSMVQTIGTNGSKIAQMVMTDSLFSTTVRDSVEVGGRNLLKDSGKTVSNGTYNIASYNLTDAIKEGEEVTLTIWGSLATTKSYFSAYNSGGSISVATLTDNGDGTYSSTFKWKIGTSINTTLTMYAFTNAQTGTSTIDKIKLEKGNVATDWTPAPEDKANQSQVTQLANNWAVRMLNSKNDIVSQINLSDSTFLIEAKNIVGLGDAVINGKLTVTGDMIAGTISADKISGGTLTGTTFNTTANSSGFAIELKNGQMSIKRAIFTIGTLNATLDATTLQPNGFAITQYPGQMFNIASLYNDGSTNSSPVIQIPATSEGASKKLNIYAQGGLYIDSDSFDLNSTVATFNVPLVLMGGLRASHAYNSTVINDTGNLMYAVDKDSNNVMFHRLSIRTKSGTWVNSRFEFYEDGRLARVVNGVRTFF